MPWWQNHIIACSGYIAPEYIDQGEISLKTDIFSLGIIMIRLLVGYNDTIIENVRIIYQSIFFHLLNFKFYQFITLENDF